MAVDTIECGFCDVEFDIIYTEEADVKYCPFCGDELNGELEDELEDYGEDYDE